MRVLIVTAYSECRQQPLSSQPTQNSDSSSPTPPPLPHPHPHPLIPECRQQPLSSQLTQNVDSCLCRNKYPECRQQPMSSQPTRNADSSLCRHSLIRMLTATSVVTTYPECRQSLLSQPTQNADSLSRHSLPRMPTAAPPMAIPIALLRPLSSGYRSATRLIPSHKIKINQECHSGVSLRVRTTTDKRTSNEFK